MVDIKIIINFEEKKQIKIALKSLTDQDVVIDNYLLSTMPLFRKILNKIQFKKGAHLTGLIPTPSQSQGFKRMINVINRHSPSQIFYKLLEKIKGKISNKKALNFLIVGGEAASDDSRFPIDKNTSIICAHAMDYDLFLNEELTESINNNFVDYSVFIDGNIFDASDYELLDINPHCISDQYYPKLNSFFDTFEKYSNTKIIIAENPKADLKNRRNPFNERKIINGNTCQLVKYSKNVIVETSTAVNFAVMYKKPVVFIDSEMYSNLFKSMIHAQAKALNSKPINYDFSDKYFLNIENNFSIDENAYNKYFHKYIKQKNTPLKPKWEIFCDFLDEME